jgi:hypothetical protein
MRKSVKLLRPTSSSFDGNIIIICPVATYFVPSVMRTSRILITISIITSKINKSSCKLILIYFLHSRVLIYFLFFKK